MELTTAREPRRSAPPGTLTSAVAAVAAPVLAVVLAVVLAGPWAGTAQALTDSPPGPVPDASTAASAGPTAGASPSASASPTASPAPSPTTTPNGTPTTAPTAAPVTGKVVGRVVDARGAGVPKARVAVFDDDWHYLRDTVARRTGRFALADLPPGRYRLQVTDTRAAWRTDLFALRDVRVRVRAHSTTVLAVTVRKGAYVTGRVTRGKQDSSASRARVRVTDAYGRHHEVKADRRGRFALGGLSKGTYRVWAEDAAHRWAGRTTVVRGLTRSTPRDLTLRLRTRTGGVNGFVLEGDRIAQHTTWVTAVHRATGQWRVVRVRNGDLSLPGLLPGRYDFTLTATSTHAGRTVKAAARVRAGRTSQVTLRLGRARG